MNYTGMRNLRHGAVVNILYDYFRKLLPLGSVEREKSVGGGLQMDLVIKYGMNIYYVDVGIASITSKDALAKGSSNIFGTASRLMVQRVSNGGPAHIISDPATCGCSTSERFGLSQRSNER